MFVPFSSPFLLWLLGENDVASSPSARSTASGVRPGPPIGPREGRGRVDKHRRPNVVASVSMLPTTADDKKLAAESVARAKADGAAASNVWQNASYLYNMAKALAVANQAETRQPGRKYSSNLTSATLMKKYWDKLSEDAYLPQRGMPSDRLPQLVSTAPILQAELNGWSKNKCKQECRARGIGFSNDLPVEDLRKRLLRFVSDA